MYSTTVGAVSNVLGTSIGCFLPSLFVRDDDTLYPDRARVHIFYVMLVTSIISSVVAILVVFTFREHPPSPPDRDIVVKEEKYSLKKDMVKLLTNKGYMLACLSSGVNVSYTGAFTTVIPQMTGIYGFTPTDGSYFGTSF